MFTIKTIRKSMTIYCNIFLSVTAFTNWTNTFLMSYVQCAKNERI